MRDRTSRMTMSMASFEEAARAAASAFSIESLTGSASPPLLPYPTHVALFTRATKSAPNITVSSTTSDFRGLRAILPRHRDGPRTQGFRRLPPDPLRGLRARVNDDPGRGHAEQPAPSGCEEGRSIGGALVEVPLLDVRGHLGRHQVLDRPALPHPAADVGRRDRQCGDLDDADAVAEAAKVQLAEVELGTGGSNELGGLQHRVGVLPGEDLEDGVGAGDEEEIGGALGLAGRAQRLARGRRS